MIHLKRFIVGSVVLLIIAMVGYLTAMYPNTLFWVVLSIGAYLFGTLLLWGD